MGDVLHPIPEQCLFGTIGFQYTYEIESYTVENLMTYGVKVSTEVSDESLSTPGLHKSL